MNHGSKQLQSKRLKHNDQHQDACFIQNHDSLYAIIATKHRLSVHSVDSEDDEDGIHSNCVINNISLNYDSKIKEIHSIKRQNSMQYLLKTEIDQKYESFRSPVCEWDSILILFENGHFGWFYVDIFNEISNTFVLWLIRPDTNYKYDTFLNELKQKSQSHLLMLNDWKLRCLNMDNMMVLSIFSFLGNVILFIPILWKHVLCFQYLTDNNSKDVLLTAKNQNRMDSLWQVRCINGAIWDFNFIRTEQKEKNAVDINFVIVYSQHNKSKILSDSVTLFDQNNKLMISKNAESVRTISIVDHSDEKEYKCGDNTELINVPIQFKTWNVCKLQDLLNNDTFLMMMCHQHSIHLETLKKIIKHEIIRRNTKNLHHDHGQSLMPSLFPKQFIKLSDYDGLIVFDFAMFHYKDNPYNKTLEMFKLPSLGSMTMDDMIMFVEYHKVLSVIFIATYNGYVYYMNLEGIRHEKSELISFKAYHVLKYVNVSKILFDSLGNKHFGFIFGELSSHKLLLMSEQLTCNVSSAVFIPQVNGIMNAVKARKHKLFYDEVIYVSYGYNMGTCIGKYECIIPTQSLLSEPQSGYKYLSKIINVENKLLVFVIADQTRIRCLSEHNLPELQINGFETNAETLSVGYITKDILLQITANGLFVIDINNGILNDLCIPVMHGNNASIIYAEIHKNMAAVITSKYELSVYQLSHANMLKMIYSVQLADEISCIKIIENGVIVTTYNGLLQIYEYKSKALSLSLSLNNLSLISESKSDSEHPYEDEEKLNMEPQENIVVHSMVIMNDSLYIGTRNGLLIEYELDYNKTPIINTNTATISNIGDLPLILIAIQINIDEQDMDDMNLNMTQFNDKNALLCIAERCWILFKNAKENKLEVWPLNYAANNGTVTYAVPFIEDGDPYLVLIVNGCMDIVRLILQPRLHCCHSKIGKTISKIKYLQQTNHLLYVSNCSLLNFIDVDALFVNNNLIVEYEANLSQCVVTDIDIIDCEGNKNNNLISYFIAISLVSKGYFKKCVDSSIVLVKVAFDKNLNKFVKFSELHRYKLSIFSTSIPYKIISFNYKIYKLLIVSMASQLLLFVVNYKNKYELIKCSNITLSDFIKDIVYDSKTCLLSILFEKNGIDIMNIKVKQDDDENINLELLNIIKSWNGVFYSSKHLLLNCHKNENEKYIEMEILICNRIGNISLMSTDNNNQILQHKNSLDLNNKNCDCCFNDMIQCKLFHNNNHKRQIVAICAKGCVFVINMQ